jgi:hypothetical protein
MAAELAPFWVEHRFTSLPGSTQIQVPLSRGQHSITDFFDVFEDPNRGIVRAERGRVQDQ